jgi:hypothetical protein
VHAADVELSCRWVKGHQKPSRSTSAFLNDQCDKFARSAHRRAS